MGNETSKKIAIIGLGQMGKAIARALLRANYEVLAYDLQEDIAKEFAKNKVKPEFFSSLEAILNHKVPTILAVKPNQISEICKKISDNRLIISIAAGVLVKTIEQARQVSGPVVRAMPNMPLQAGHGMTALFANENTTSSDRDFCFEIFNRSGETLFIDNEAHMHIITALSGSGPAFIYQILQAFEDAGVLLGLPRDMARKLVRQTTSGSVALQKKTGQSPQELIHQVTSPAGTTMAGLKQMKRFAIENAIIDTIKAATERSMTLSK